MTEQPEPPREQAKEDPEQRVFESESLFADQNMVYILHENELYRLMKTKSKKLILQK